MFHYDEPAFLEMRLFPWLAPTVNPSYGEVVYLHVQTSLQ